MPPSILPRIEYLLWSSLTNRMKQMNFSGPDIDKMANYKDTDGLEVSAAAQKWLNDHKSKWEPWVASSK